MIDPRLGKAIRRARGVRDLRQKELAGEAGITEVQLSNIELGKCRPTRTTLLRICVALKISEEDLRAEAQGEITWTLGMKRSSESMQNV